MEILANCYLQDVIKHECWDSMCVKGQAIKVTSGFYLISCASLFIPLGERQTKQLYDTCLVYMQCGKELLPGACANFSLSLSLSLANFIFQG